VLRQGPTAPPGDRKSLNSGVDWIVTSDEPRRFRRGSTDSKNAIRQVPGNRGPRLLQSRIAFNSTVQPVVRSVGLVSLISLWPPARVLATRVVLEEEGAAPTRRFASASTLDRGWHRTAPIGLGRPCRRRLRCRGALMAPVPKILYKAKSALLADQTRLVAQRPGMRRLTNSR
jgi:hypothetical protein